MTSLWAWLKKYFWLILTGLGVVGGLILGLLLRRSPEPPQALSVPDPYRDQRDTIEAREKAQEERDRIGREEQAALTKNKEALIRLEAARRKALREGEEEIKRRYETEDPEQIRNELLAPLPPPKQEGGWVRLVVLSLLILGTLGILLALSCLDSRAVLPEALGASSSRPVCLSRAEAATLQIERLRLQEEARACQDQIRSARDEERIVCRASLQRSALDLQTCRGERTRALSRPPCPPQRACSCVWPVVGAATAGILIGGALGVGIGAVVWR